MTSIERQQVNTEEATPPLEIDRKAPELLTLISAAPIYAKFGTFKARPGIPGEAVITILKVGTEETPNVAEEGDMVLTNPLGEQYIVPKNKFSQKYEETNESGVYKAKGLIRAIRNPFSKPIKIQAEWGETQQGTEDCWVVDTSDENGVVEGEPYIIGAEEFASTYKLK